MKILTSSDYEKEFLRLLSEYEEYYWSVAWASIGSKAFDALKNNRHKIIKIVVGLHFYQTHPDFINEFLNDKSVKYILETEGTYHPKLYLFKKNTEWELIIGSPNFTVSAFTKNSEISILLSSKDDNSQNILSDVENFINIAWNKSKNFDENELSKYRNNWKPQNKNITRLSGLYGTDKDKPTKPIFETLALSLTWLQFLDKVKKEVNHNYKNRIAAIRIVQKLFKENDKYMDMTEDERKFIAGIPNNLSSIWDEAKYWPYFGSMKGAGTFQNKIRKNEEIISVALDQIPLKGLITKQHYLDFWNYYGNVFGETAIATATRLLAMKRPDYFICLDTKNKKKLCSDFAIKKSINKDNYWDTIIERIFDSPWWQEQEPDLRDEDDRIIYNARVAFLDSIFYEG